MFTPEEEAQLRALIELKFCKVIDKNQLHSTFEDMAEKLNATKWCRGRKLPTNYKDILWKIIDKKGTVFLIEANDTQYLIDEKGVKIIKKVTEPVTKKRAFYAPERGEHYVCIYASGLLSQEVNIGSIGNTNSVDRGNAFPATPEGTTKAKALVALEQHIVAMDAKYGEPKKDYDFYCLTDLNVWILADFRYGGINTRADYQRSGSIMHIDTTPDERAHRLKLLQDYLSPRP